METRSRIIDDGVKFTPNDYFNYLGFLLIYINNFKRQYNIKWEINSTLIWSLMWFADFKTVKDF